MGLKVVMERRFRRRESGAGNAYPSGLITFVTATTIAAVPAVIWAVVAAVRSAPSSKTLAGVTVLLGLALLAELRPVPVDVEGERLVSLAFVFVISTQMLFTWEWSVIVGVLAIGCAMVIDKAAPMKLFFNSAVYALAAILAAAPMISPLPNTASLGYAGLTAVIFAAGAIFVLVNVALVCGAISLSTSTPFPAVLSDHLRHSGLAFLIMGFIAAQTVIFWNVSPFLVILVSAPLFTLNLYQRSLVRGRAAQMQATTDSLTGLRNHRAFQDELAEAVEDAAADGEPVALCLIDVDRFKQVNDRCGHPAGDLALKALAALLHTESTGAYRLGGDEFALILRGPAREAELAVCRIKDAYAMGVEGVSEPCTISGGIAVFPEHAPDVAGLKAHADLALYLSKRTGKNRVNVYRVEDGEGAPLTDLGVLFARDVRLRLAEKLISVVDARDSYVGEHSTAVADLVVGIGRNLGVDERDLRHLYVAALLHDLGKIGIPDNVLRKPGSLTESEHALMQTHPKIGFDLLDGLDLSPVDTWILHHHEHFDGGGYPFGLAGEQIPLGSRIILVADAFNAMTTRRSYREPMSAACAMEELRLQAGTQFDPAVVDAIAVHLERTSTPPVARAA